MKNFLKNKEWIKAPLTPEDSFKIMTTLSDP